MGAGTHLSASPYSTWLSGLFAPFGSANLPNNLVLASRFPSSCSRIAVWISSSTFPLPTAPPPPPALPLPPAPAAPPRTPSPELPGRLLANNIALASHSSSPAPAPSIAGRLSGTFSDVSSLRWNMDRRCSLPAPVPVLDADALRDLEDRKTSRLRRCLFSGGVVGERSWLEGEGERGGVTRRLGVEGWLLSGRRKVNSGTGASGTRASETRSFFLRTSRRPMVAVRPAPSRSLSSSFLACRGGRSGDEGSLGCNYSYLKGPASARDLPQCARRNQGRSVSRVYRVACVSSADSVSSTIQGNHSLCTDMQDPKTKRGQRGQK